MKSVYKLVSLEEIEVGNDIEITIIAQRIATEELVTIHATLDAWLILTNLYVHFTVGGVGYYRSIIANDEYQLENILEIEELKPGLLNFIYKELEAELKQGEEDVSECIEQQ